MRYHDIITERLVGSGARPYPYELASRDVLTHEPFDGGARLLNPIEQTKYMFVSDNGLAYIVHCNLCDNVLETSFTTRGGKTALNSAGDAFRVLATVAMIIKTYVEHDPPFKITFTADRLEPSRVKLYDRFCQNLPDLLQGYRFEARKPFGRKFCYTLVSADGPQPLKKPVETERRSAQANPPKLASRPPTGSLEVPVYNPEDDEQLLRDLGM